MIDTTTTDEVNPISIGLLLPIIGWFGGGGGTGPDCIITVEVNPISIGLLLPIIGWLVGGVVGSPTFQGQLIFI